VIDGPDAENTLFIGWKGGVKAAAIVCALIETARLNMAGEEDRR